MPDLGFDNVAQILNAVRTYDHFDEGIDPCGEHDIGRFTVKGEDCYWKINHYDQDLSRHSSDPADLSVTIRVLTIMRVDVY